MSTRSSIIIKLEEKDLDRSLKVSEEFAKTHFISDDTFKKIGFVKTDKKLPYIGIYCHHDGYPDGGIGETLVKSYKTYQDALDLILCGYTSWIDEDTTGCYVKNESWQDNMPDMMETPEPVSGDAEYVYLFKDGRWLFSEVSWNYTEVSAELAKPLEWKDVLKWLDKEI